MKVLLGMDDSRASLEALEETLERVRATGDDLTVAVLPTPETAIGPDAIEARVRKTLDEAGVEADIRRLSGDAGSSLVELADREGFERIVLSGGMNSPLGKITLDDVAEFVLLNANTTVTLVR